MPLPSRTESAPVSPPAARRLVSGLTLLTLACLPLLLGGCGALVVGGVAAGAAAVYDRRPYHVVIDDQNLELLGLAAIAEDPKLQGRGRITVTSYNLSVLLTGQVETDALAAHASDLISQLPKVRRVIDELTIGPPASLSRKSQDALLTSRAKLAIASIRLPGFDVTRVKIVTEDGVAYLLGLVTPEEAEATTEQVRYVNGVQRVVKLFEYRKDDA